MKKFFRSSGKMGVEGKSVVGAPNVPPPAYPSSAPMGYGTQPQYQQQQVHVVAVLPQVSSRSHTGHACRMTCSFSLSLTGPLMLCVCVCVCGCLVACVCVCVCCVEWAGGVAGQSGASGARVVGA